MPPLCSAVGAAPGALGPQLHPQYKRDRGILELVQGRAVKVIEEPEVSLKQEAVRAGTV